MINFFKQSVHHSLFNNITSTTLPCHQHSITADHHRGLSILANYDDFPKPNNNVIESWSLINSSRKNKEAVEITVNVLGGDGLDSCTESLGFESYTERNMSSENGIDYYEKTRVTKKKSKIVDRRKEKNFPPPLKSLNENGKAMFVLKPVRKDGRLEVQIHRKESLHACREDGRLRIYLVEFNHENDTKEEDKLSGHTYNKQKQVVEEDCRWLNEMVVSHGHHHHNMHGWGQQCVTIR